MYYILAATIREEYTNGTLFKEAIAIMWSKVKMGLNKKTGVQVQVHRLAMEPWIFFVSIFIS